MTEPDQDAVRIVQDIRTLEPAHWDACAAPPGEPVNPFVLHRFLAALEASGSAVPATGWQPVHLVVDGPGGVPRAAMPLYLKSHSQGEYVFDHGWADALHRAGGRYYPKLLCAVPFTPATGPRLLVRPGGDATRDAAAGRLLLDGACAFARQLGASSVHLNFLTAAQQQQAVAAGFLARLDQQFHWHNPGHWRSFDDFVAALSSKKRKNLRRERRDALAGGVEIVRLTGDALEPEHWDAFWAFYMDTGSRKWGRPYLTREFFTAIQATFRDRTLLVLARRAGRWIAGALNFIGDDCLYGRNWGCIEDRPFLHFEVCYHQAIDFALERGLARVEAGAQGAHKVARGYLPVATRSAHWIAEPGFRIAVARYLERERSLVEEDLEGVEAHSPYRIEPAAHDDLDA